MDRAMALSGSAEQQAGRLEAGMTGMGRVAARSQRTRFVLKGRMPAGCFRKENGLSITNLSV